MRKRFITWIIAFAMVFAVIPFFPVTASAADSAISLEAPRDLSVTFGEDEEGKPCFNLKWTNPQSVTDLNNKWAELGESPLNYQIDMKVGDGKWDYDISGDTIPGNSFEDWANYDPINEGKLDKVDIKANVYQFRVRYAYLDIENDDYEDHWYYSSFSEVFTIGIQAVYKDASSWAIPELDKAAEYGFITEKIKDKMNGPISREEFAEIAVKLYEKTTGKQASYTDMNAFVDTVNPEVFKAYTLGIVAGTNKERKLFSPAELTNREQVATMLYRTIHEIGYNTDSSSSASPAFNDESMISAWALDPVIFMSTQGYIKGSNGNFDPKGTCTREMAVLIALRVFEDSQK